MVNLIVFFVLSFLLYWIIVTVSNAVLAGRNLPVGGDFIKDFKQSFYDHGSNLVYAIFVVILSCITYLKRHGFNLNIDSICLYIGLVLGTLSAFYLNRAFFSNK